MNRRQREVMQSQLDDEERVIRNLKRTYAKAREDIEARIARLDERADMEPENIQSIVHQKKYQEALRKQIDGILDDMLGREYKTVSEYLDGCYRSGYLGAMYDLHGQNVPIITPINQDEVARAVKVDSKLSAPLYESLGENVRELKGRVRGNLSRFVSQGRSWTEAAAALAKGMRTPYDKAINYAIRIARTEGHRIQNASAYDAMAAAKEKGADVVKQWDSTLDGSTRKTHRKLDGQIRELDEPFEVQGHKAKAPGHFGRPEEDINCRCTITQRARWALDEDELRTLEDRAAYYGLDKTADFEDFKGKYLKAAETVGKVEDGDRVFAGTKFTDGLTKAFGEDAARETMEIVYDCLENCPVPSVANVWRRNFHNVDVEKVDEGAWYTPGTGQVSFARGYIDGTGAKSSRRSTVFHEVGHSIDDFLKGNAYSFGKTLTRDGELGKIIFADWNAALEVNGPKKAVDKLNELWKEPSGDRLVEYLVEKGYMDKYGTNRLTSIAERLYPWVESLPEKEMKRLKKSGLVSESGEISGDWILTATGSKIAKVIPEEYRRLWDDFPVPDKRRIVNKIKLEAKRNSLKEIFDDLRQHDREVTSSLSDWLECLTGEPYPLGWGHGKSYWTRKAFKGSGISQQKAKEMELGSEAFAELFEMCLADQEAYELTRKYFPNAVEWFESTIKERDK